MELTIKNMIPPPKGYEYTGDWRAPFEGQYYLDWRADFGGIEYVVRCAELDMYSPRYILRPIRWRAKGGEYYHYVNSMGGVDRATEDELLIDDMRRACHNYFQTIEKAEASPIYKAFNREEQ